MGKTVVLAEKPSVGRDIARVLGCTKKTNSYMEGKDYIVTWALGHLVTLADPETYDDKYKTWKIEDLPMLPEKLKLVVIKQTGRQFSTVKTQLNRSDVSDIVIATDAGREGELVARWILEKARVNKPVKRLWISSVTDKAIKDGFKNLRSGKEFENLYKSAVARSEADWYVGLNATRALTTKFNAQLSSGRVQTPTLAMVHHREEEIKNFKPEAFYGIEAKTQKGLRLVWKDQKHNSTRTFAKDKAEQVLQKLKQAKGKVTNVEKKLKKSYAPQLYDLTELQRDANRLFGFGGKETLNIMQHLYERHKLLTYPRTDSRYLSSDIVPTLKDRVKAAGVGSYGRIATKIANAPIKATKAFVDDNKVSDHHAIIPTDQNAYGADLSDKERKIYDLVIKRFFAVLFPAFEYEQTTLTVEAAGENFTAKGKIVKKQGWKEVYANRYDDEESDDDQTLPNVEKGEEWTLSYRMTTGETKPPERFTEGTLLHAMENPVRFMAGENKDLIKTIGQTGGLGTVATRADIIDKLFNTFYIEKQGKYLKMTSKGRQLLELVPEELKSPALTAEWEMKLSAIAEGKLKQQQYISEMKQYAKKVVNEIKNSEHKYKHDNITGTNCPDCGKLMLEVNGKRGRMLVCQDRECGHKKNIAKTTNARCPNCHKRLELRGEGEGQMFFCKCGHREKLSTFNERRKKEKNNKVSKRDVQKYLKKNNEDDGFANTALADALAKLKKK
ncbi:DNA topoisomerase III [Terribacillus halophilus]|jgi:DNA topoisomerase III|uniref:DNA topoisomerase III n=1 Tax=Terribacillus halophilus TaxID=361279 RepID=UPI000984EC68|nr:DNA topoisomerase III [Terribacillus halophilus]